MTTVADNIRRSLEILKFSNTEGLKKTIDSLNQQPSNNRMSRSSDHLNLSNADPSRVGGGAESSGSMSNSTSSLNISDLGGDEDGAMEALALTSSASSLPQSVDDQKDVREDVQEVHDQFRWNVNSNTALLDNQPRLGTGSQLVVDMLVSRPLCLFVKQSVGGCIRTANG